MALQCTCHYPPWPTKEVQRRKTGVDSALFEGSRAASVQKNSPSKAIEPSSLFPPIETDDSCSQHPENPSNHEAAAVPPLSASLQPTGSRIVDQLGLPFKTAARKRFHALYTDAQADPRDNV